ncbi:MAG: FtsW/RodA/SpoVE family cell cycle protein, partial [Patescibacteria group bacterium]
MAARSHAPDYVFIGGIALITVFGLVMLASATSAIGFEKFGDTYYFLKRQLLYGFLPGIVAFFVCLRLPYAFFRKSRVIFFMCALALLLLVLMVGVSFGRTQSWLMFGGFSFQPAEIAKVALILFLAGWLDVRRGEMVQTIRQGVLPFLCIVGTVAVLLALQPDIGTLAVVLAIAFGMFFAAGARWKHIAVMGIVGIIVFGALVA